MDWTQAVDGYCERIGSAYWAEPVNALTNLAFVLAALFMWRRVGNDLLACLLCGIVFAIGVGSYLFHTHAQVWAGMADVLPIGFFILIDIFAINRVGWQLPFWPAIALTGLFVPYAAITVPVFQLLPSLGSSAGYAPVPVLIFVCAILLRHRDLQLARGLALGAGLLVVSLTFRTLDMPLCPRSPVGTHFAWQLLNGLMLGWVIEVYRRARLGKARA